MFGFSSGLILGIILSTVGVNGIVKLSDNILNNVQDKTREATYSQNQDQQQSRQVPPSIPSNQNQQQSRQYPNTLPDERRAPQISRDIPSYIPQIDRDITQPSYIPQIDRDITQPSYIPQIDRDITQQSYDPYNGIGAQFD